jgi:hypothetical protein
MKNKITVEIEYNTTRPLTKTSQTDLVTDVVISGIDPNIEFNLREDLKRTLANEFNEFLINSVKDIKPVRMFNLYKVIKVLIGNYHLDELIKIKLPSINAEDFAELLSDSENPYAIEISEPTLDKLIYRHVKSEWTGTGHPDNHTIIDVKQRTLFYYNESEEDEIPEMPCYYKEAVIAWLKMNFGIQPHEAHLHIRELKPNAYRPRDGYHTVHLHDGTLHALILNFTRSSVEEELFKSRLKLINQQYKLAAELG